MPWPPPQHLDPFKWTGGVTNYGRMSAKGQWEDPKQVARNEGVKTQFSQSARTATVDSDAHPGSGESVRGCNAISAEPNTTVTRSHIREHIDEKKLKALDAIGFTKDIIDRAMIMEEDEPMGEILNAERVDVEVEMALDSGCCDHVMDVDHDAAGYDIHEPVSNRRGRGFLVGNGERLPNQGEVHLNLEAPE